MGARNLDDTSELLQSEAKSQAFRYMKQSLATGKALEKAWVWVHYL